MRTLVRPGKRGVIVKVEGGPKGTHFLVSGPGPTDRQTFFDPDLAARSFEAVEQGNPLSHEVR